MEKIYNSILSWIRKTKSREKIIILLCKFLPYITGISYIGIIIYAYLYKENILLQIIVIPSTIFIFISVIRKIWNRSRPYETLNITPLFQNKKGESTPSRHTASAFSIALSGYLANPHLGYILLIIAGCIAISRFIAGVHYLSDIVLAIIITLIMYFGILISFPV